MTRCKPFKSQKSWSIMIEWESGGREEITRFAATPEEACERLRAELRLDYRVVSIYEEGSKK